MPTLIIQTGKHRGQKLILPDAEVVVGRDDDCQIRVASSDVSRRHCAIRPSPEGTLVRDLGSRNGTLINDMPIEQETLLEPGDILRIGPMQFQVAGTKGVQERPRADEPQAGEANIATDDAIAHWLTGDEPAERAASSGDTTIVPSKPSAQPAAEPKPKPTRTPPKKKKEFHSIAEEAADIIRRHWESEQEKKPGQ